MSMKNRKIHRPATSQTTIQEVQWGAFSKQHPHFNFFFAVFLFAWIVSGLAHVKSFSATHIEGDETVYLTLSREMNWNLTHYTTKDDPNVSRYPYATYRHPLFVHPPLYPLILKMGGIFGQPLVAGLLFANLSMGLLLLYAWRVMVMLRISPRWSVVAFVGILFCPLLFFSTSRLHTDGLLAIWLTCALVAYMEALDTGSDGRALLAGGLLVVAMNMRYTGIIALPLLFLIQGYYLHRLSLQRDPSAHKGRSATWNTAFKRPHWRVFAIVMALVLTLGMQHYYRVFATFGTLLPGSITVPDSDVTAFSPFMRIVLERSRWQTLFYFAAIFPIALMFITPWPYRIARASSRRGEWGPIFLCTFLFSLALTLIFTHTQIRYFALAMPALYLCLPMFLERSTPRVKAVFTGLGLVSLWLMLTTGFLWTTVLDQSAAIIPSVYYYFPFLKPWFDLTG